MPNRQAKRSKDRLVQGTPEAWHRLRLFNYFRSFITLLFITIYFNGWFLKLIPEKFSQPELFITVSFFYLIASLIFITGINYRKPGLNTQVILHTLVDITCIIVLMHATGGVRTGLGMLLIISTSMTSIFLHRRTTILFSAIAALSAIGEQIYSRLTYADYSPAYTQAGLLGALIFISAFLTIHTARRLKETEKIAENASQELEAIIQMNEHIIKSMRTGILVVKNNGLILMANNAALELLGNISLKPNMAIKDISLKLHQRFTDWDNNSVQNHQPIQQAHGLPDLQAGFSRIDREEGKNNGHGRTLIFIEDATQIAQRFQQVKLASLGRLTASIAHEIRNPLAAINHAGQLLAETVEDKADTKLTNIINTQAKRLNGIIENVLQLSRQQNGTAETIHLSQWLTTFRNEFISTHKLKGYQIQFKIVPESIEILFDSTQLHQVMWNLCSNSINHSKMSHSNLMINILGKIDPVINQPYIDIADNGLGIDKDTMSHIFDPFFTTSAKGTGLGLYITKEVIESNRAKIRHISPPTGGTCFRIVFQQARIIHNN